MNQFFTINSRKYDGSIHRTWNAELKSQKESLLIFEGVFEEEINHNILGVIRRGTISYEYYWTDRWYNIFRFHEPNGDLRNFYCNVSQPPTMNGNILDYTDFDIDILVNADLSYQILDVDEFNENRRLLGYTSEIVKKVDKSVSELINLIENKDFPFDL